MSPGISTRLLATQSDERLLALAREGHERAFEALVLRYRKPLLAYCRRLSLPDGRVEDVLQQALLKTWIALRDGAEVRDIKAWLYRVVHNTAVNAVRDAARERERLRDPAFYLVGAAASQGDPERGLVVREALGEVAALPELQREVIVRTAVGGHSHEQVASDLGITDGAVRGLLYRARATLRTAATALTPPPLLGWIAGRAERGSSTAGASEALGGLAAGGGVAGLGSVGAGGGAAGLGGLGGGLGGLLVKGGVVAITAGTLITGAVVHLQGSAHHRPASQLIANAAGAHGTRGAAAATSTSRGHSTGDTATGSSRRVRVAHPRRGQSQTGGGAGASAGGSSGQTPTGRRTGATAPAGAPTSAPAPSHGVLDTSPPSQQGAPAGGSGQGAPAGQGAGGQQSPTGSTGTGTQGPGGGASEAAKPAGGSGSEQPGSGGQTGSGTSGSGSSGSGSAGSGSSGSSPAGSGSGGAGSSGSEANGSGSGGSGSTGSGSSGSGSSGSGSSGNGESQSSSGGQSEGGLVGTVVHEVGNLLEHILH